MQLHLYCLFARNNDKKNTFFKTFITPCVLVRTRGRVIGLSIRCLFVDTKMSTLSETGQFMKSTFYARVRNCSFYMPHEREHASGSSF